MLKIKGDFLEVWCEPPANFIACLLRSMDVVLSTRIFVTFFLNTRFHSAAVRLV